MAEAIVAVASVRPGASLDEAAVRDGVRERLSSYKVPRRVVLVDEVRRAPNGKADYPWAKEIAATQ